MANEITTTGSLSVYKPSIMTSALGVGVTGLQWTMTGNALVKQTMTIGITPTAFDLGAVASPHWAFFRNLDPTNYVQLQNGASGAVFGRLLPGEWCIIPLDPICLPYGLANVAPCLVEYLIASL